MLEDTDPEKAKNLYDQVVDMVNTDGDMKSYASIAEDGLAKYNTFSFKKIMIFQELLITSIC